MNISDDSDKKPHTVSIPVTDAAASSSEITIQVDPDQTGATTWPPTPGSLATWPLTTSSLGPGPRKHPKDKSKAKKARKAAKASRRRNR